MEQDNLNTVPKHATGLSRRSVIVAIVIFILLVAGMFTFAFLKRQEIAEDVQLQAEPTPTESVPYADVTRIDAKHFFADGTHTIVGELALPTPCDLLQTQAEVAESFPEQVTLEFTVINNAEFCAQVVTTQRFMVTADASEQATFSAKFEGRQVLLNLIPAGPNETPDDFELFIKG